MSLFVVPPCSFVAYEREEYWSFILHYQIVVFLFLTLILDLLRLAVVNLTLIDLPGLTKVAVGMFYFQCWLCVELHDAILFVSHQLRRLFFSEGQPESIVEDIENMVRSYVEKVMNHYEIINMHKHLHSGSFEVTDLLPNAQKYWCPMIWLKYVLINKIVGLSHFQLALSKTILFCVSV